jgi:hypothetical protein
MSHVTCHFLAASFHEHIRDPLREDIEVRFVGIRQEDNGRVASSRR